MGFFEDVKRFIQGIVDYLTSDEGQEEIAEGIKAVVDLAKTVIMILTLFNYPLTPGEKRELFRRFFEILRKMDDEDFEKLVRARASGALGRMSDKELDALAGNVLALGLQDANKEAEEKKKKAGKAR